VLTEHRDIALDQKDLQAPGLASNQSIEGRKGEIFHFPIGVTDVAQLQIFVLTSVLVRRLVVAIVALLRELQQQLPQHTQ
jgi:hypothetical protein